MTFDGETIPISNWKLKDRKKYVSQYNIERYPNGYNESKSKYNTSNLTSTNLPTSTKHNKYPNPSTDIFANNNIASCITASEVHNKIMCNTTNMSSLAANADCDSYIHTNNNYKFDTSLLPTIDDDVNMNDSVSYENTNTVYTNNKNTIETVTAHKYTKRILCSVHDINTTNIKTISMMDLAPVVIKQIYMDIIIYGW